MDKREIKYRQFLCAIPICCLYFMIGLGRCWVAPVLNDAESPHSELPLTTQESSWLACLGYMSRGLSPILIFFLVDRIGRNSVIVYNSVVFCGMWIAVYCSRDISVHFIIRLVFGLSDGLQDTVASIYVCENCSPELRGTFFTIAILFLFSGQLIVYVLSSFCSYSHIAITYFILGFVSLLSTFLLVEPAQFFLMKGNTERAENNFGRLRDMDDPDAVKEFEAIKMNIEEEKSRKLNLALYRSKEVRRSLRLVLSMMSLSAGCGWGPVMSFVTKLFSSSDGLSANQLSIFYGIFQVISVSVSSFIMERFNRRILLLFSTAVIATIQAGIVALYCIQSMYETPCFNLILFILLTTYSCVCAMFQFPLIGLLRGELLPQSVKMVGNSLSTFVISVVSFTIIRIFLPVAEAFGTEFNFAIYSCSALLLFLYTYFDLPETQGKTLVQIQNELRGFKEDMRILESSHL